MNAILHLPDGSTRELTAVTKHPTAPLGYSVWVDEDNHAYSIVGQEEDSPYPITIPEPHATRLRIGLKIALLRGRKGMTQRDLANITGYRWQTIAAIEAGRFATDLHKYQQIAEAVGGRIDIVAI